MNYIGDMVESIMSLCNNKRTIYSTYNIHDPNDNLFTIALDFTIKLLKQNDNVYVTDELYEDVIPLTNKYIWLIYFTFKDYGSKGGDIAHRLLLTLNTLE